MRLKNKLLNTKVEISVRAVVLREVVVIREADIIREIGVIRKEYL